MTKPINIIAIIPARGGSEGVQKKNIRTLHGKPLIQYTIDAAKESNMLNHVMVSTDDSDIAEIAVSLGAEVPFMRPAEYALSKSSDADVLKHALYWIDNNCDVLPDLIVYLRPTTPFKTGQLIDDCIRKVMDDIDCSGLRTVTLAEGKGHPYWMFKPENNRLVSFIPNISIENFFQRQLLPTCYALNGMVDILRPEIIRNNNNIFGDHIIYEEVPKEIAVDIDTEIDLLWAEFIFSQKPLNDE